MIPEIVSIAGVAQSLIEKFVQDPNEKARRLQRVQEMQHEQNLASLNSEVQLLLAQAEVNKNAAQHKSVFVAGARPAIIWMGAFGIAYQFIVYPLLCWLWVAFGGNMADAPPVLNGEALTALVTALLGVGTMRSFDKMKGTATNAMGSK